MPAVAIDLSAAGGSVVSPEAGSPLVAVVGVTAGVGERGGATMAAVAGVSSAAAGVGVVVSSSGHG